MHLVFHVSQKNKISCGGRPKTTSML